MQTGEKGNGTGAKMIWIGGERIHMKEYIPMTFSGDVIANWCANGRDMILRLELTFIDGKGKEWVAPAGSVVDGASIPRFMWRFVGSPFCGKYRRASVVHDVYCVNRSEAWQDVHRVFLEMMRVDGVSKIKRWIMFVAVWFFGPRWQRKECLITKGGENRK